MSYGPKKRIIREAHAVQVYKAIVEKGLEYTDFYFGNELSNHIDSIISVLRYEPRGYYFTFDFYGDQGIWSRRSPGRDQMEENHNGFSSWKDQYKWCREWLDFVKEELEAPDIWTEFIKSRTLPAATPFDPGANTPFTEEEQDYLTTRLDEFKEAIIASVSGLQLPAADLESRIDQIESELSYIKQGLTRLGRIDWKNILIASLLGLIINVGCASDLRPHLFKFIWLIVDYALTGNVPSLGP
jgi:hypothetical protein